MKICKFFTHLDVCNSFSHLEICGYLTDLKYAIFYTFRIIPLQCEKFAANCQSNGLSS